ncbi:MAG: SAM-dependent methyltransferase [Thermoanaerobaculia bacterium]
MSSLSDRLRQRILSDGPIPFSEFMEEALYGEGGYYRRRDLPIGRSGDFVTGASLSPLFGQATAWLLRRLDRVLGSPAELLEAGYGNGEHLRAVLESLEGAASRRVRGWETTPRPLHDGAEPVGHLDEIDCGEIEGLIFSYELFDAQPVHRLIGREGSEPGELWVHWSEDAGFELEPGELSEFGLAALIEHGPALGPGQIADLSSAWRPLYRRLASRLGRGLVVTCDYGFEIERLLDPRVRFYGTLACYRSQTVHRNPMVAVGQQDLTAHVDFSALREEGERLGLETLAFTRQARWLAACGIFEGLEAADQVARLDAMTLLDPDGMGEEIRVLVQGRGVETRALFDLDLLGGG